MQYAQVVCGISSGSMPFTDGADSTSAAMAAKAAAAWLRTFASCDVRRHPQVASQSGDSILQHRSKAMTVGQRR